MAAKFELFTFGPDADGLVQLHVEVPDDPESRLLLDRADVPTFILRLLEWEANDAPDPAELKTNEQRLRRDRLRKARAIINRLVKES